MRLVIIESPYAGATSAEIARNVAYGRACVADSLARGEAPIASHLLHTQPGVLRDEVPAERQQGIDAGLAWLGAADASVAYIDLGITPGMQDGMTAALTAGKPVEKRTLPGFDPSGFSFCAVFTATLAQPKICAADGASS
jgi:hypothetical protein